MACPNMIEPDTKFSSLVQKQSPTQNAQSNTACGVLCFFDFKGKSEMSAKSTRFENTKPSGPLGGNREHHTEGVRELRNCKIRPPQWKIEFYRVDLIESSILKNGASSQLGAFYDGSGVGVGMLRGGVDSLK